jgi:hypothetical protein
MTRLPYLLPWVRVLILIRSITSTTWGHEAWPEVKPVLRRALEMRRQIAGGVLELNAAGRRLRAAFGFLQLVRFNHVAALAACPWTLRALWPAALGTVAVTAYCTFVWTRE